MNKVLLGMSGGIDSTASAVILKEKGYSVTGITFISNFTSPDTVKKTEEICNKLDLPYIVLDITKEFEKNVIEYFIESYESGNTPNPCVECNRSIKFGFLYDYAINNGYDYVASGHYAKIESCNNKFRLTGPKDNKKDQTYFLYVIKEEQLKHTLFPLQDLLKSEAREICAINDLLPKESKESQEICFIKESYKDFLKERNAKNIQGNFIYSDGSIIQKHSGILNYTIGQRKGLNLALGKAVFVKSIDVNTGDVVICDSEDLFSNKACIKNISLIDEILPTNTNIYAKIRYAAPKTKVTLNRVDDYIEVTFLNEQRAISKGQSLVLYTDDYVIGGGIIF